MLFAIYTYSFISILISPIIFLLILYRANTGKEDLSRLKEKLGFATKAKKGKIIWLHASSVGETTIALNLVNKLSSIYYDHNFLLTTGTVTSANLVSKKAGSNIIHQYVPVDVSFCVNKFLRYWQPEVGIFLESEIWPNLIYNASSKLPIILINAKMSDISYQKWNIWKFLIKNILNRFKLILAQTQQDYDKFIRLGAINVINAGNLKFSNAKPSFDQSLFEQFQKQVTERTVLLAASTHEGDEEFIIKCYKSLKSKYQNLILIIVPRHPSRSKSISKLLTKEGLNYKMRTLNQTAEVQTDVYIADTIGELGMFFNVADVSFIGGSLKNGGHNIIEPSFFKTAIIFGPDMSNFIEVANEYISKKAALSFSNIDQAIQIIDHFLANPKLVNEFNSAATKILQEKKQILTSYLQHIGKFIKQ